MLACAAADVSHLQSGYDYPAPLHEEVKSEPLAPQNTYVPPPAVSAPVAPAPVAPAPVAPAPVAPAPVAPAAPIQLDVRSEPIAPEPAAPEETYIPPAAEPVPEPSASLETDGYHYKTVRRVVYRHRV